MNITPPLGMLAIVIAGHLQTEQRLFEGGWLKNPEPSLHPVAHATKGESVILTVVGYGDFPLNIRPHADFSLNPRRIR